MECWIDGKYAIPVHFIKDMSFRPKGEILPGSGNRRKIPHSVRNYTVKFAR